MSDNTSIARPYAKAVFEHALESQTLSDWSAWLAKLDGVASSPDFQGFVQNPRTTVAQHAEALVSIMKALLNINQIDQALPDVLGAFIHVLADNKRILVLSELHAQFEALRADEENRICVRVSSFSPLDEMQQARLAERLSKRLKRAVTLDLTVDPALLGGAVICANDWVIDASVKGQLDKLGADLVGSLRG
ncbi:MAG: F0F1 ATP synthase subunit delta [Legionella sp.]|jgi:F-type H+-transporting ATPase subunit delta|nr:F0F1 ATP synthase subunit delta [Legionella sp.]